LNRATSLYLDVVRPVAAFVVLLSHVSFRGLTDGQLGFLASAGVQAVDVFFVLSGFVIAHVTATRELTPTAYIVNRAARIYSVAIPALILTWCVDAIGLAEGPETYQGPFQPYSVGLVIRSLFFIGEQWNVHRFPGSNGPYWSLGFEVWYYIAFGAILFVPRGWRWLASGAVLVAIGPKVTLLFPAWLMGVATYRACANPRHSTATGWMLFTIPLIILAVYQFVPHPRLQPFQNFSLDIDRLWSLGQDYLLAGAFSVHLIGFATIARVFSPFLERYARVIRWVSGATFSIYLMHLPIMHMLASLSPWPKSSPWTLGLLLAVTPMACLAFAEITERRRDAWRWFIANVLGVMETSLLSLRKSVGPSAPS
jgi:peptidoglycan/LPS O-acetylase OafA/YrhL